MKIIKKNKNCKVEFTLKNSFLKCCPKPEELALRSLMNNYDLPSYLHNKKGPAVVNLTSGYCEYWENGKALGYKNNVTHKVLRKFKV